MDGAGKLLIRADVGPAVGTARVARCLALAQAWIQMGGSVSFICGQLPPRLIRRIHNYRCELIELQDSGNVMFEFRDVNQSIKKICPDWLILDGGRFDQEYQSSLIPGSCQVARLGDFPQPACRLNDSGFDQAVEFQWALIADDLRRPKSESKRIAARARHLLVAMFAGVPCGTTMKLLDAIDGFAPNTLSVDVVLVPPPAGADHKPLDRITLRASESRQCVRVHGSIDRLRSLIGQADIAVTDAGNILPELCHRGIPILFMPQKNHAPSTESTVRDAAIVVDERIESTQLANIVRGLICDQGMRQRLSEAGQKLVDGDGARRMARHLAVQEFHIRSARREDAPFTHRWRNDPEVRANFLQSQSVTLEAHHRWLAEKTNARDCDVLVIEDRRGNPVGQANVDYAADFLSCEFQIHIVPALRGHGIGTALIEKICQTVADRHPEIAITARIKVASLIAQSAFKKAGFQRTETTSVNRLVASQFVWRAGRRNAAAVSVQQRRQAS